MLEILEGGEKVEICNTGGIPAGLQVDPDNVIWIADMKRGILKTTREGELAAVVETYTKSLWAYDVSEPGTAKNKRLFTKIPGDDEGGPDGMDFDEAGNLLVAHWAGSSVDVFTPDGELLERVEMPFERTTNVHFGGEDDAWVYVTAGTPGELWKFKWDRPGQKQFCER